MDNANNGNENPLIQQNNELKLNQNPNTKFNFKIFQNTTHIPNNTIRYITQFVNPYYESKIFDRTKMPLKNIVVRIVYEDDNNEFLDIGKRGRYTPEMYHMNKRGLIIHKKPMISIIIPNRDTKFPLYPNYDIVKPCKSKNVKLATKLMTVTASRIKRRTYSHSISIT